MNIGARSRTSDDGFRRACPARPPAQHRLTIDRHPGAIPPAAAGHEPRAESSRGAMELTAASERLLDIAFLTINILMAGEFDELAMLQQPLASA